MTVTNTGDDTPQDELTQPLCISDKRRGFFIVYNDVLDTHGADMGSNGIAVYAALCRFANRDSGETFVGQERLAQVTGLSERTVRDTIKRLVEVGVIEVGKSRKYNSNLYTVHDRPAGFAGSNRQHLPPNNTQGTRTNKDDSDESGENPRQSSPVAGDRPNPLAEEYERLRHDGASLREVAVGLVRFAQGKPRETAGALGMVYRLCFGNRYPPNYPRLMRMANRAGGPERLATRMLDVAAREVLGNPHDVLEKWRPAWEERKANENKTNEVSRTWGGNWQPPKND